MMDCVLPPAHRHTVDQHCGSANPITIRLLSRQAKLMRAAAKRARSRLSRGADRARPKATKHVNRATPTETDAKPKSDETSVQTTSSSKHKSDESGKKNCRASDDTGDKKRSLATTPKCSTLAKESGAARATSQPQRDSASATPKRKDSLTTSGATTTVRRTLTKSNTVKKAEPEASSNDAATDDFFVRCKPSMASDSAEAKAAQAPPPMRHAVFRAAFASDGEALSLESISLRESKRDVQERRESLATLEPSTRRAWELDCGWREADVMRIRQLSIVLCDYRRPWPELAAAPHHREVSSQGKDMQARKRDRKKICANVSPPILLQFFLLQLFHPAQANEQTATRKRSGGDRGFLRALSLPRKTRAHTAHRDDANQLRGSVWLLAEFFRAELRYL